jgi:hypothetical protein
LLEDWWGEAPYSKVETMEVCSVSHAECLSQWLLDCSVSLE